MTFDHVAVDSRERHATIKLDRPEKLNALSTELSREVVDALEVVQSDRENRVVVITGMKEPREFFSAGADVDEFYERVSEGPFEMYEYQMEHMRMNRMIAECDIPVIAKVNGPAHGAAAETISRCDIRVASTDAELVISEMNHGIFGLFLSQRPHLPEGIVRELAYTGRPYTAEEGEGIFWNRVVAPDDLNDATDDIVEQIVSKSPQAIRHQKSVMEQDDFDMEKFQLRNVWNFRHPDFMESVKAFREDREPSYAP